MQYTNYDKDGRIIHANKVYVSDEDHVKYQGLLKDMGQDFVVREGSAIPRSEDWFVSGGELALRPNMDIWVNKTVFKVGSDDAIVLKKCLKGSRFEIQAANVSVWSGVLDGEELEIHSPVPCKWTILLDYWPYRQFRLEVEAVA